MDSLFLEGGGRVVATVRVAELAILPRAPMQATALGRPELNSIEAGIKLGSGSSSRSNRR